LHIKHGTRAKATILQLGYPGKNSLRGWYHEHEQRLDCVFSERLERRSLLKQRSEPRLSIAVPTIAASLQR